MEDQSMSSNALLETTRTNFMVDLSNKIETIIDILDQNEGGMAPASAEIHELDIHGMASRRKSVISGLQTLLDDIDIPELTDLKLDPMFTQATLLEKLNREVEELEKVQKHEKNKLRNLRSTSNGYTDREQFLKDIECGLEEIDEEDIPQLPQLQAMFAELKQDMETVLRELHPDLKDDIKSYLATLEQSEKSGKEEDRWKQPEDISMKAVLLLTEAKVIISHPQKENFFKLAC